MVLNIEKTAIREHRSPLGQLITGFRPYLLSVLCVYMLYFGKVMRYTYFAEINGQNMCEKGEKVTQV